MKNAKTLTVTTLLAFSVAAIPVAHAQSGGMGGMDMKDDKGMKGMDMKGMMSDKKGQVHKASGTVNKMEKGKVTIKHEPVPSMSWPAMTMTFTVKDKALMEKMQKDQKVDFEFVQSGKDYMITEVK